MPELGTSGSVGARGEQSPGATQPNTHKLGKMGKMSPAEYGGEVKFVDAAHSCREVRPDATIPA